MRSTSESTLIGAFTAGIDTFFHEPPAAANVYIPAGVAERRTALVGRALSNSDDHVAALVPSVDVGVRLDDVLERIGAVYDRVDPPRGGKIGQ